MSGRSPPCPTSSTTQRLVDAHLKAKQEVNEKLALHKAASKEMDDFQRCHYTTNEEFNDIEFETAYPMIDEYKVLYVGPCGVIGL